MNRLNELSVHGEIDIKIHTINDFKSPTYDIHCVKVVQIRSFFWSIFSRIRTEYGEIRSISPYSVRMRENTDQKKLRIWTHFTQWLVQIMRLVLRTLLKQQVFFQRTKNQLQGSYKTNYVDTGDVSLNKYSKLLFGFVGICNFVSRWERWLN